MPTSRAPANSDTSRQTWRRMRWGIALVGIALPYIARLGMEESYAHYGWQAQLYLLALGAVLWLPLLGLTWCYRFPVAMWPALLLGLGFGLWAHVSVDLAGDAQAGLAVLLVPLMALVPAAIGALMGWGLDIRARRKARLKP